MSSKTPVTSTKMSPLSSATTMSLMEPTATTGSLSLETVARNVSTGPKAPAPSTTWTWMSEKPLCSGAGNSRTPEPSTAMLMSDGFELSTSTTVWLSPSHVKSMSS